MKHILSSGHVFICGNRIHSFPSIIAYSNDLHHSPQQKTAKYLIGTHMLHILSADACTGNFASAGIRQVIVINHESRGPSQWLNGNKYVRVVYTSTWLDRHESASLVSIYEQKQNIVSVLPSVFVWALENYGAMHSVFFGHFSLKMFYQPKSAFLPASSGPSNGCSPVC